MRKIALAIDECVSLFNEASTDPILSSVQWYGGDGVVLSPALTGDAQAAAFAVTTKFIAPNFGLPTIPHPDLATISAGIIITGPASGNKNSAT